MVTRFCFSVIAFILIAELGFSQVNLQNGSSTFSLPIFSWDDNRSNLNSGVVLSYNSGGGLKVNDVASNIGQGWGLIAGGVITRIQNGEPDDQYHRDGTNEFNKTGYPDGILYATTPAINGCPEALSKYPIYGWKNQIYTQHNQIAEDKQLDYFSFQFNGKAGMFVLDSLNNGKAISVGDSKIKITFQTDAGLVSQSIRTRITSFSIQDVDGVIYKFAKHGLTKVLEAQYCDESLNYYSTQPKFQGNKVYHQTGFDNGSLVNPYVISGWYLTEIEDALTQRKVLFKYETRDISSLAGEDIMYNMEKDYSIIFHKRSITKSPVLDSIVYPDSHYVKFNYGSYRTDLPNDKVMTSIEVTYKGRYLSKHELNTTYIILNRYGTPVSDYQKKVARLYLKSIRKIGVDLKEDSPPYIFDYYTGSSAPGDFVPPPFFYAKDIWGYYNGDNSTGYWLETIPLNTTTATYFSNKQLRGLCFRRSGVSGVVLNAKTGYAKNGLLRQIIYPTGGTLTYSYDQNTGTIGGSVNNVGGVHVTQTSSTDGGFTNNCSNPITTNYSYIENDLGGSSSLWGLEMPVNSMVTENHYQPEWKYYKYLSCFPIGCCDFKFKYPGILSQQQAINLTQFQEVMRFLQPVLGVVNVISTIQHVVTALSPSGGPVSLIIDVIVGIINVILTCTGNQAREATTTTVYNTDLNSVNPLPTQFKRVEVTESSGGIGKTVQEFTSDSDYPIWELTNSTMSAKQRYAPWAYGLPKRTLTFNAAGDTVKEVENTYSFSHIIGGCGGHGMPCIYKIKNPLSIKSCKCQVKNSSSQRGTTWSDPNEFNNPATYHTASYISTSTHTAIDIDIYDIYTGRLELISTTEKNYKPSSTEYLEIITSYDYNNTNFQLFRTTTTQSNGDINYKEIKYTSDYNSGILSTLNQNNILNVPVASMSATSKSTAPAGYYTLGESVTEFSQLSNGDIKPYRTLEQRFTEPLPLMIFDSNLGAWVTAFKPYLGPGNSGNSPNYKQTQLLSFDANGNLTGIKDEASRTVANLYDYDDKYIVASIINSDPSVDKCAYASFEPSSYQWIGFSYSGMAGSYSNNSITGSRSMILSSTESLTAANLNTAKPYILSFWSTSSGVTITGGTTTLIKSAPIINGFTYYEYEIAQGASTLSISGNVTIDELRLYPKSARMRTITYDPLIGKTSECDENNRVTYFEYDNLGRLRFIKDDYRNIIKMYEYNNISLSKQNGCPGTYYNKLISEEFIKSNCGTGYLGDTVTYTVPANTYSSTISQDDADAQAENNILANGQNYANTNGTCLTLYCNSALSQNFTTENCPSGYVGGTVTYSVPAGRYCSTISQAYVDTMALDDIDANGQAYANDPAHQVCTTSSDPLWTWLEGAGYYCLSINGNLPPHLFVFETDINPNSSTYLQTRWADAGVSELCPAGNYYNSVQSQNFTRNNCASGYTGSVVTYTVPAGTYSSTVSQAAANQLALNDISANGQNYANTNGACTQVNCTYSNCESTAVNKHCVNDVCQTGFKVYTDSYFDWDLHVYVCTYHWEWSDGAWSLNNYTEYASHPCAIY